MAEILTRTLRSIDPGLIILKENVALKEALIPHLADDGLTRPSKLLCMSEAGIGKRGVAEMDGS